MAKSPSQPSRSEQGTPAERSPAHASAPTAKADATDGDPAISKGRPDASTSTAAPKAHSPTDPSAPLADDDCVRVTLWHRGRLTEWRGFGALARELRDPDAVVWLDLTDPPPEHVAEIARILGLHPLVAEDILEGNQRAKIEVTDQLVHIVMFALEYSGQMIQTEIDFVLGPRFLLTVHEKDWDPRATSHLRDGIEQIIRRGPDHLLWALVDALVDSYFPFVDKMGDEIDEIEDEVVLRADSRVLARLFQLKKDLLTARRAAAPVREIFNQLTNRDLMLIDREEVIYFRDVYDHLIRLVDELDNYRELVSSALDVYLSTVNNNLSLIMKRLTGVTVILAGIGAVAGIFGMSEAGSAFQNGEAIGFWVVTGFTISVAVGAAAVLRKIGWI